ncbi:cobalamin 5'-phosphate synthase [Colwellia sp. MT41]|uniref:Co-chaperone protein HscB homolog n=1 Tax=Colwellia marinimaniae TaxID=1513592 RepID=A0ABQ0MR51_9GAMM|nr:MULTISPECIES: co-chaperone HscB [Colwellia]ALO34073.1 cobalamin 5'-phosphate synthase [Colwellia sp. MT41]GAW94830.1 co-chaperone protein HscB homolog [Colwellia marinimaniae]
MNYFQLFGIEASFDLDLQNLSSSYQALQKAVHPDKFAHASDQDQRIAVQKSAQINDAYQTLKQPLPRAEYILVQRGVDMPNEQHSFSDTGFLLHQMELREMLEDVKQASDADAALLEVQRVLSSEYLQLTQLMRAQISENNSASNNAACDNLRKLKFYQKLNIEVDRLEDALFDD